MATQPIQPQNPKVHLRENAFFQKVKSGSIFSGICPASQLDNITEIEQVHPNKDFFNVDAASKQPLSLQREQTNKLKEEFIKRVTYYTIVNLLYNNCTATPLKDDSKFFLIVNELLQLQKPPGHFKIIKTFLKYFKESNWISVTFYYFLFCGWLPRYYIKEVTNNVVQYVRDSTNKGQRISPIISKLFKILNDFLVEYNQIVSDFTKNPHPALRADYVQTALKDPKYLKNLSDFKIYQTFSKLCVTKFIPDFDWFRKPIESARRLDFWKTENPIFSIIKGTISTILYPLKFWEWLLGSLPTKFIKRYAEKLLEDQVPKMLESTFDAIGREPFAHAINSSIYAFLTNILNTEKKQEEDSNYVDGPLKSALYEVGKNLLFTLDRVNFQSAYELRAFEKDGRKKSFFERTAEKFNFSADEQFAKSLQNVFVFTFNYLSNPKRAEPYLSLVFNLLSKTFEKPQNSAEPDEEFFKKEYEITERKLDEKIDQFITFIIEKSVSENFDEALGRLSLDQKEQVKSIYRNLTSNLGKPISKLQEEALEITEFTNKISLLTPSENDKLKTSINTFFEKLIIFQNDVLRLSKIPSPLVKKNFEMGTTAFRAQEHLVNKNLISLKALLNQRDGLFLIIEELKASNHTITNITAETDLNSIRAIFQASFDKITALNTDHQFDKVLKIYSRLIKKVNETIRDKNYERLRVLLVRNNLLSQYAVALIACKKPKALEIKQEISELLHSIPTSEEDAKAIEDSLNAMMGLKTPRQIDHALQKLSTSIGSLIEAKSTALRETPLQVALQPLVKYIQQTIHSIPRQQTKISNEIQQTGVKFSNATTRLNELISNLEKTAKINGSNFLDNLWFATKTTTIGGSALWLANWTLTPAKMAAMTAGSYIFRHTASHLLPNIIKSQANSIASPIIFKYIKSTIKLLTQELGFYQGLAKRAMVAFITENKMVDS